MEAKKPRMRKHLCLPGLLKRARQRFSCIKDSVTRQVNISLTDCLMSGLAIFGMKYPSLLQFDKELRTKKMVMHNLQTLYHIQNVPSDTYLVPDRKPIFLKKITLIFSKMSVVFQQK